MGASAGGDAAADVATGTEETVFKGWSVWGDEAIPARFPLSAPIAQGWPRSRYRRHLHASIRCVMDAAEMAGGFDTAEARRLLVFTTKVRRRDGRAIASPTSPACWRRPRHASYRAP